MATISKRVAFLLSEEGQRARVILQSMDEDTSYNTKSSYSADAVQYPDNKIPFVDKHMNYLNTHPSIVPQQYLSNLRLMTRLK